MVVAVRTAHTQHLQSYSQPIFTTNITIIIHIIYSYKLQYMTSILHKIVWRNKISVTQKYVLQTIYVSYSKIQCKTLALLALRLGKEAYNIQRMQTRTHGRTYKHYAYKLYTYICTNTYKHWHAFAQL